MFRLPRFCALVLGAALLSPTLALADTTITAAGSTALLPLVKSAAEAYQNAHSDVKIIPAGGGSRVGITQVAARAVDLGDSDIVAKGFPDLVDHRVAVIGFSVIVNSAAGVNALTKQQLRDIFSGVTTNWNQVGGKDQKIVVINRPRSSGTRAVFTKVIMGSVPLAESGLVEDASGTVVTSVATTPGSISYVGLSYTEGKQNQGFATLKIDGVAPTPANIESGKYPIWSYEHIYTNGVATPAVANFLTFIASNTSLLHHEGYIGISEMKVSESDR